MKNICIVGTGGFAREVLFLIDEIGIFDKVRAFIEPDHIWQEKWKDAKIMDIPVLPFSDVKPSMDKITIGVADPGLREKTTGQLDEGCEYMTLIHPHASVSRWTQLGKGAIVTKGCIVTTQIEIGQHCQLNLNTTVGHDCRIGNFFTTAPSVNISGICNIGNGVYFGTGAGTKQGISICNNVIIGMGAMVVKNIEEAGTYVGIPATKVK